MKEKNNFRFWLPVDDIQKSKDADGKDVMMLAGIASTARRDTDGESINPKGFELEYAKERGIINWAHSTSPDCVIGEPVEIKQKKEGLFVKSMLYSNSKKAKQVYELAETLQKSGGKRRLGYSVEGRVIERDPDDPTKVIKCMLTNIAVCISPKNPDSIVDIIKGEFHGWADDEKPIPLDLSEDTENLSKSIIDIIRPDGQHVIVDHEYRITIKPNDLLEKALSTGTNTGVTEKTSGAPLIKEDLDKDIKDQGFGATGKKKDKVKKDEGDDDDDDVEECVENDIEKTETSNKSADKILTKAEVISRLQKSVSVISISKANEIYSILNNLSMSTKKDTTAKENESNVTEDLLEKALQKLDVKKGKDEDDEDEGEMEDKPKPKKKDEVKKAKPTKKEENDVDDEDEDEDEVSQEDVDKKPKKGKTEGVKKEDEVMKGLVDTLKNGFAGQHEDAKSMGIILKGLYDMQKEQSERLEQLTDQITELVETPAQGRKSIAKSVDRNFGGNDADTLSKGNKNDMTAGGRKELSVVSAKATILEMMDSLAYAGGNFNKGLADAMGNYECSGTLSKDIVKAVEDNYNVVLVK